jgi:hypothetical protein
MLVVVAMYNLQSSLTQCIISRGFNDGLRAINLAGIC